jgi:hypothetical protein
VSKKTIAFTMPATGRRLRDRAPVDLDAPAGESAPIFTSDEPSVRDAGSDSESDEWVRDRDLRLAADPSPAPSSVRESRTTIDLAAERNLAEVLSLSFLVPFALGWFWFANAMNRRSWIWGP